MSIEKFLMIIVDINLCADIVGNTEPTGYEFFVGLNEMSTGMIACPG